MQDTTGGLSFDRAEPERARCGNCNGDLEDRYWTLGAHVLCEACQRDVSHVLTQGRSPAAFARATLYGTGTALACGAGYALFVHLTGYQLALITIAIAYAVARVLRHFGGAGADWRYRAVAVLLTYVASTLGYAPAVWGALSGGGSPSIVGFVLLTLVAPFAVATQAPLGLLIVGFGLWEAWRRSAGVDLQVLGPFAVTGSATAAPAPPSS